LLFLESRARRAKKPKCFLGARNPARLLVGREDSVVSLWASRKRILGSAQDYITTDELLQTKEVFFSDIFVIDILGILMF
jgi:hypothetical protein